VWGGHGASHYCSPSVLGRLLQKAHYSRFLDDDVAGWSRPGEALAGAVEIDCLFAVRDLPATELRRPGWGASPLGGGLPSRSIEKINLRRICQLIPAPVVPPPWPRRIHGRADNADRRSLPERDRGAQQQPYAIRGPQTTWRKVQLRRARSDGRAARTTPRTQGKEDEKERQNNAIEREGLDIQNRAITARIRVKGMREQMLIGRRLPCGRPSSKSHLVGPQRSVVHDRRAEAAGSPFRARKDFSALPPRETAKADRVNGRTGRPGCDFFFLRIIDANRRRARPRSPPPPFFLV